MGIETAGRSRVGSKEGVEGIRDFGRFAFCI
jgi:hypothetical protein